MGFPLPDRRPPPLPPILPTGVIEIGCVRFTEPLKRTVAATEVMYLMLRTVLDLGDRRCEWRCDALNGPWRAAAESRHAHDSLSAY